MRPSIKPCRVYTWRDVYNSKKDQPPLLESSPTELRLPISLSFSHGWISHTMVTSTSGSRRSCLSLRKNFRSDIDRCGSKEDVLERDSSALRLLIMIERKDSDCLGSLKAESLLSEMFSQSASSAFGCFSPPRCGSATLSSPCLLCFDFLRLIQFFRLMATMLLL